MKKLSFKTLHCAAGVLIYGQMKHIKILIKKFFRDLLRRAGCRKKERVLDGGKTFMFHLNSNFITSKMLQGINESNSSDKGDNIFPSAKKEVKLV